MISIKNNREFQRAYSKGRSFVTKSFVLYAVKNRQNQTKIGFTVSKKIGNAVTRNRARRRLKEAIRELPLPEGYDLVLVARGRSLTIEFESLKRALQEELNKLG
ncbi:ribonuclease P protein component [Guggenheimella bovis]